MMARRLFLGAVAGLLIGAGELPAQQSGSYVVVVNAANSISSLTVQETSRLFQKKTTRWKNGQVVVPVDLPDNAPVRERFSEAVHGRSVSAMKAYWHRQIFSGRSVPPVEKASDAEVLQYVAANANAIGYVSTRATINGSVKVVRLSGGGA